MISNCFRVLRWAEDQRRRKRKLGAMSSIAAGTGMGAVHLAVTDGSRASRFYQDVVGLTLLGEAGDAIRLGTSERALVVLHPRASQAVVRGTTGLYHLAIVLPSRVEFAKVVARLIAIGYPHSPTDHTLTKSDYLWDPDGNGIEIYCESPEDGTWEFADGGFISRTTDGRLTSGRDPIDIPALMSLLDPDDSLEEAIPAGSRMGHVHLHIHDLHEATRFYHEVIGFDVTGIAEAWGVSFVSAGGYHHHLGLNIWAGQGASPSPSDSAGLIHYSIEVPTETDLNEIIDRLHEDGAQISPAGEGVAVRDPSLNLINIRVRP